jgi:hypothetical protein
MSTLTLYHWWEGRQVSQTDLAIQLRKFVNELPRYDPIYASWLKAPKAGTNVVSVPTDDTEAKRMLIDNVAKYDDGRPWPELGSRIWAGHAGTPPYDFRPTSYADTSGFVGASRLSPAMLTPNHIFMRLSEKRPSTGRPWRASELRLMKFTRSVWNPSRMCAHFNFYTRNLPEIGDPTWAAGKRSLQPWIGWITYLPPDLAARAKCPSDVDVDTLDDGAALVTLCEEPFDQTDTAALARLHALETALRPIQS